jgi:hypothetical protein
MRTLSWQTCAVKSPRIFSVSSQSVPMRPVHKVVHKLWSLTTPYRSQLAEISRTVEDRPD